VEDGCEEGRGILKETHGTIGRTYQVIL
jgi:hypothetical protein